MVMLMLLLLASFAGWPLACEVDLVDNSVQHSAKLGRSLTSFGMTWGATFFYWWLPLLVLCLLSYWIQINVYLRDDIAIISHTAAQMLLGQTYAHGIIEPNPPMIFYLNFLPVIISKMGGVKIIYAFRAYVITLILVSVVCSHYLFKILFQLNTSLIYIMSYALACILLFLPVNDFGQREHFLLILSMPYFLLAACRLQNKVINQSIAVCIGIMAGIGFSIKPFFVPTLLLIELLFVYRNKNVLGWVRVESLIAIAMVVLYGLSVIVFYPDYLHIVLPLWMPFYSGRYSQSWTTIISFPYFIFPFVAIALSCFTQRIEQYSTIKIIFSLAMIGFVISFLIPRVAWYYHVLPAFSIACLYFVLILGELACIIDRGWVGLLGAVLFFFPIFNCVSETRHSIAYFHSDTPLRKLTSFLNQQGPDNAYDYFSVTHKLNILEFHSTANYVGTFPFFWEFGRIAREKHSMVSRETLSYVLNIISHDLDDKKPRFIIIDNASSQDYLHQKIDYPREYASNKHFCEAWSHYDYLKAIDSYDIYQRVN